MIFAVFDLSTLTACIKCIFTFIFAVLLPVLSSLSCHCIHDYTATFWKMNTRHQARKPVNECNYWSVSSLVKDKFKLKQNVSGDGQIVLPCQISRRSVIQLPRYRDFSILRWRPEILLADGVHGAKMHHRAKYCRNRSIHCRYIAICFIFQYGCRTPSWISYAHVWTTHEEHLVHGLYNWAKYGWNWCSSFGNMRVLIFCELGWKTPIHAPKWGFGVWTTKLAVTKP